MKEREEDVESAAQLLAKENTRSSSSGEELDQFDYAESDDSQNWSPQRKPDRASPCRHLRSVPIPSWVPVRKVNPKYFVIAFVVSLVASLFVFNPYAPSRPPQPQSGVDISGTATKPAAGTNATWSPVSPSKPAEPGQSYVTYKPPKPEPDDRFCTTWPVDDEGRYSFSAGDRNNKVKLDGFAPKGGWKKPKDVKVIGMVFYGRKRYVDVLDCYLQQNLATNGGYFDEVWFMAHTEDEDDVAWVEDLVARTPGYKIVGQGVCEGKHYSCMWNFAVADNTIYIKIDDDIVYIHPDAVPQLVHTRINLRHPYAISSNLINSPVTGMESYHYGAIHPFLPDPRKKHSRPASESWRLSDMERYPEKDLSMMEDYDILNMKPPYRGHPWLLISDDHYDLLKTPMGRYDQERGGDPIAFGPAWKSWGIAVQQQYSLLYNLEKNKVQRYFFGRHIRYPASASAPNASAIVSGSPDGPGAEQTYDTGFKRYNLNFVAVWGSDIRDQLPIADDDEQDITSDIPRRIARPFLIDTRSVVAHFSFFTQQDGVTSTDLLDRWRAFANEAVCEPTNLKKPWDLRCDGIKVEDED